jgi:hypothetical protein
MLVLRLSLFYLSASFVAAGCESDDGVRDEQEAGTDTALGIDAEEDVPDIDAEAGCREGETYTYLLGTCCPGTPDAWNCYMTDECREGVWFPVSSECLCGCPDASDTDADAQDLDAADVDASEVDAEAPDGVDVDADALDSGDTDDTDTSDTDDTDVPD